MAPTLAGVVILASLLASGCVDRASSSETDLGGDAGQPSDHRVGDGADGLVIGDLGPWKGQPAACGPLDRPCFFGATFADCGKNQDPSQQPLLYCSTHEPRCVWVSDGCPMGNYRLPFGDGECWCVAPDCNVGERGLQYFFTYYGKEPWTRERGLVIPVVTNAGNPPKPAMPPVTCQNLNTNAWKEPGVCDKPGPLKVTTYDTTVFRLQAYLGIGHGWLLEIEVDEGGPSSAPPGGPSTLARICRLYGTDFFSCGGSPHETPCATKGTVTLVRHDGALHLDTFHAEFPSGAIVTGTR